MQCVLVADDRVRSLALTSLLMDILDDAGGGAAFVAWAVEHAYRASVSSHGAPSCSSPPRLQSSTASAS